MRCGAAAAAQAPRSRDVVAIIIAITSIPPITSSSAFTHQPEVLFTVAVVVVIGNVIIDVIVNRIVAGVDIILIVVVHIITILDNVNIIIIITCDIAQTDRELSPVRWRCSCESV
jgi:hypothetical protein